MRYPLVMRPSRLALLLALALPLWIGCADPPELSSLERGKQHFDASRWDEALAAFDDCLREQPRSSDAYRWRGHTRVHLGQLDRAVDDYNTAVRLAPDDPEAYYLRSEAHDQLGNKELSVADYRTAKQLDPLVKTLYERTPEALRITLDNDTTARSPSDEQEQQNPRRSAGREPVFGAFDDLFDAEDDSGDNTAARSAPSFRRNLPGAAGTSLEAQENLSATPIVPLPAASNPDSEKTGDPPPRAIAPPPRPSVATDPPGDGLPPPVFETPNRRGASADQGDVPQRHTARDGRRSPGITTGTIRLAPSAIPSWPAANDNNVTSPFDARLPVGKQRRPKSSPHHFKDARTAPDLTLNHNPYSPQAASDRKKTKKTPPGAIGTAPALPKKNVLPSQRELYSADRLNPYKPLKLALFGPDSPLSKRPSTPYANASRIPPAPLNPTGITPPRIGTPGGGGIGPGTIGNDPLRSNPFHQIEPDAFNPYKTTPITGNPYGAAVPNLPPLGLGGAMAPSTPFGIGGFHAPRRNDALSGLYGLGSLPGSPPVPSSDLQSLLRPNSGLNLRPGGPLKSPFSAGAGSRKRSTTTPRPRIGAPHARGFGGSSSGPGKNPSPWR